MTNFHILIEKNKELYSDMIERRLKERHSFKYKESFYDEIRQIIQHLRDIRNRELFYSTSELLIALANGRRLYTHNGISIMLNSEDNKIYTIYNSRDAEFNLKLTYLDYKNFYTYKPKKEKNENR